MQPGSAELQPIIAASRRRSGDAAADRQAAGVSAPDTRSRLASQYQAWPQNPPQKLNTATTNQVFHGRIMSEPPLTDIDRESKHGLCIERDLSGGTSTRKMPVGRALLRALARRSGTLARLLSSAIQPFAG